MMSARISGFDLLPPVHMRLTPPPLWTSTYRRHKIHSTLLKELVQRPSRPKDYNNHCNLFKAVILVRGVQYVYWMMH